MARRKILFSELERKVPAFAGPFDRWPGARNCFRSWNEKCPHLRALSTDGQAQETVFGAGTKSARICGPFRQMARRKIPFSELERKVPAFTGPFDRWSGARNCFRSWNEKCPHLRALSTDGQAQDPVFGAGTKSARICGPFRQMARRKKLFSELERKVPAFAGTFTCFGKRLRCLVQTYLASKRF